MEKSSVSFIPHSSHSCSVSWRSMRADRLRICPERLEWRDDTLGQCCLDQHTDLGIQRCDRLSDQSVLLEGSRLPANEFQCRFPRQSYLSHDCGSHLLDSTLDRRTDPF